MEATYYIPKKPDTVPFIDKEKGIVEIMIDGEMVELSISLFEKLFKKHEKVEKKNIKIDSLDLSSVDSMMTSMKNMTQMLKKMGTTKDELKMSLMSMLESTNMVHAKDVAMKIIDELYES